MEIRKNRKNITSYVARKVDGVDKPQRLVHINLGKQDKQDEQGEQEELMLP